MMLLLHVLMLSLLSGGSAKVVPDFEENCDTFFANGKPPTTFNGSQYEQICQTLNNVVYYATYYDTLNRIPVYSAYKFEKKIEQNIIRKNNWFIEPQLDEDDKTKSNMASEGSVIKDLRGKHQALSIDYENSGYDKGHLVPVSHAPSQSCSDATFTLTNAAPQYPSFNQGQWRDLEANMAKNVSEKCLPQQYSAYIVTGVVPGTNTNPLKNRVNVPSHFWTAFCCLDQNKKCQISRGFIGENNMNIRPRSVTVNELETDLAKLYGVTPFKVFTECTTTEGTLSFCNIM